ncbi:MAG: ABC transporter substrate-binding protein [Lachnospiraceae bacterium]|nr:ABC transporter substrate-binding protein [Lachnospiraceae bacterium]
MRKFKQILAILLTAAMAGAILAGCGDTGAAAEAPAAAEAVEEAAEAVQEAAEEVAETAEAAEAEAPAFDEITDIEVVLSDLRGVADNAQPIIDAMNAITEETIGVHANIKFVATSDYRTQVPLMLASGEQVDILTIFVSDPVGFTSLMANGQLIDITDYLEEEGQELLELIDDYKEGMSSGGRIYGIPCFRNYASANYFIMRKDVLEDLGILDMAEDITTFTQMEDIFAEVAANTQLSPTGSCLIEVGTGVIYKGEEIADQINFDTLGDQMNLVYTDMETGNISLLLENPDYRTMMDRMVKWRANGWFDKDREISSDHVDTLMKAGTVFSSIQTSEMGVETAKQEATGYEVVVKELSKNMLGSSYVNKFGLGVSVTAQEPEAAVRWMNALYTDPRLENLLIWGTEGVDYVVVDGEADFPEGITAENVGYHSTDFMYGNYFNCLPWNGQGADFRQRAYDYLRSSEVSPYMGFSADMADIQNLATAVNSVYQKYYQMIWYGNYDDAVWQKYVDELKVAGIDEYLGVYQSQLAEWQAANN